MIHVFGSSYRFGRIWSIAFLLDCRYYVNVGIFESVLTDNLSSTHSLFQEGCNYAHKKIRYIRINLPDGNENLIVLTPRSGSLSTNCVFSLFQYNVWQPNSTSYINCGGFFTTSCSIDALITSNIGCFQFLAILWRTPLEQWEYTICTERSWSRR